MQFLDVTAGPIDRWFGLATVQLHTAAATSDARIPGLPLAEARGCVTGWPRSARPAAPACDRPAPAARPRRPTAGSARRRPGHRHARSRRPGRVDPAAPALAGHHLRPHHRRGAGDHRPAAGDRSRETSPGSAVEAGILLLGVVAGFVSWLVTRWRVAEQRAADRDRPAAAPVDPPAAGPRAGDRRRPARCSPGCSGWPSSGSRSPAPARVAAGWPTCRRTRRSGSGPSCSRWSAACTPDTPAPAGRVLFSVDNSAHRAVDAARDADGGAGRAEPRRPSSSGCTSGEAATGLGMIPPIFAVAALHLAAAERRVRAHRGRGAGRAAGRRRPARHPARDDAAAPGAGGALGRAAAVAAVRLVPAGARRRPAADRPARRRHRLPGPGAAPGRHPGRGPRSAGPGAARDPARRRHPHVALRPRRRDGPG